MNAKHFLGSKTLWVNTLGGIVSTAGLLSGAIPMKYAPAITAVGGIANILLRLVTSQPLTTDANPPMTIKGAGTLGAILLVLSLGLGVSACQKPDLPTLLSWAQAGIDADCQFGAGGLAQDVCTFGGDAVSAAQAAYAKDPTQGVQAVKKILVDAETRTPEIKPYFSWLSDKL